MSRRIDESIRPDETEALERHISECAGCRAEGRDQERIRAALAALPPPETPEGFSSRLRETLLGQPDLPARSGGTVRALRLFAIAAGVLLACAVAWLAMGLSAARMESARLGLELQAVRRQAASSADRSVALATAPSEAEVIQQLQAFHATRDFLGPEMRWMVTDGDQVEVGMSGEPARSPAPDRGTITLSFEYRDVTDRQRARVLSSPQFVLYAGEEASVRLKGRSAGEPILGYRVVAEKLVDGRIRADVSFANASVPAGDVRGSLAVRALLTPGKPVLVGAGGDGAQHWELLLWGVARPAGYAAHTESKAL